MMKKLNFSMGRIPLYTGLSTKHKKTVNLILGGIGAMGVLYVASSLLDGPPQKGGVAVGERRPEAKSVTAAPGANVTPEQYWMNSQGEKIDRLMEWMKAEQESKKDKKPYAVEAAASAVTDTPGPLKTQQEQAPGKTATPVDGAQPNVDAKIPKGINTPVKGGAYNPNAPGANAGYTSYPPGVPNGVLANEAGGASGGPSTPSVVLSSVTVTPTDRDGERQSKAEAKAEQGPQKRLVNQNFIPVGFVRAKLIGGLDAPTGGQAQSDPIPVPILLKDNGFLPNNFRSKIKDCFVIAHGHGDISSERAYLRLVNLSCVMKDGRVIEVKAQGSVFGDDGKNGVRGRLVTKQGQILANALMAGIAAGIGKGFSTQGQTLATSPLGTTATQSKDTDTILRNGLGQGTSDALNRLAQYWIAAADKMFPVIEVDAARDVDIVFTQGIKIDSLEEAINTQPVQDLPRRAIDRAAQIQTLIAN